MDGTTGTADTAAPSSGGNTPTERPTFEQAFAADASPASDSPDASTTPASAATSPESGTDAPADDRSPFIPRPRFDQVNTERNELKKKVEALQWAESVNPDAFAQVHGWFEKARADPEGFLLDELSSHPQAMELIEKAVQRQQQQNADAYKSFLGRKMAQLRQQQPDAEVQFLIPQADGSIAVDMAALPKWQEQQRQKILQSVTGELQPIKERLAAEDKRIESERQTQAVAEFAAQTSADARTWPGMDNDAIRQQVAARYWQRVEHKQLSNDQLQVELNAAWREVAVPQLNARSESKLLDSLQQKAHASTGVAPGSASSAATGRPKSFDDPSLKW